jgi:hypothetical protein
MTGLKFRIGAAEQVLVSFREHEPGGGDWCRVHLSLRIGSLRATEQVSVAKSDLTAFVASIQTVFGTLAGEAALRRKSGETFLSLAVGSRGQIEVGVNLADHHSGHRDFSWGVKAEFSFAADGRLRFIDTGGLEVERRYLVADAS